MTGNAITRPFANRRHLLIKPLLRYPLVHAPDQEIAYCDLGRRSYREFRERLGRLASGLAQLGVKPGDVVAVLGWDSHRYQECYFAVPMMGATLQTVNLSLPPESLLFAINDAAASTVLVNADFLPLMEKLAEQLTAAPKFVLLHDRKEKPTTRLPIECEYEEMLAANSPFFQFPDFDENTRATTFHTAGARGRPKGGHFSHRQLLLHTLTINAEYGCAPSPGRVHRDDVYTPLTPTFTKCGRSARHCRFEQAVTSSSRAAAMRSTGSDIGPLMHRPQRSSPESAWPAHGQRAL